ncbi:hypothetical protein G7Y89_g13608 [Cudoniella acicularis]|uniref:mRNA-capping enzyme subunit beta n=1 Tax=Cudoniella acicularis TaxID=354080 RepID=A0A8H4R7X4_9HELO|nr:hypothetical protein G7Y89_g13608 [Cudoniella acicularis]
MDLRSIINTEAGESNIPKQAAPVTPIQAPPQQGFRDYSHPNPNQASPGKHPSQDYNAQTGAPYASPSSYPGPYQGRPPPPPPIQPPQNDLRSPARSYSAQSPYQHTPSTSSTSQYPFPQSQTPQSPAQHQQYPVSFQQRDSYPLTNAPPHLQHHNSHSQVSPAPQTPPIGIPGAPHPYLQHQRSQSSLSAGTPTSAQSQPPYYNQYPQDSPVSANHFPPTQIPQHQRQQSQPGTPLGPPLTQRQSSVSFPQPTSPFQQRGISAGSFSQFQQTSPAPPAPASIPRLPSTPSAYESHRTSTSEQQRRSQSEKERSISVSPKTRLPSQPRGDITTPQSDNDYMNSSKRKMEDREPLFDEPRASQRDTMPAVNGTHRPSLSESASPKLPPKKRIRYTEPPIWAQSIRTKGVHNNRVPPKVNGKQPEVAMPPTLKVETNGRRQISPSIPRPPPSVDTEPDLSALLGPWEACITGTKPVDQMNRTVADFFFRNVVSRGDLGELSSRGVEIEIEAKLGQLIDKETNQRFQLPVLTGCIVAESPRIGFRSSMTVAQHSFLNEYLNKKVADTHPGNQTSQKKRVPIDYLHRRETDKFYELPPTMHASLPAAVREHLTPRQTVKVRVTYDQKTNQILAKIVKARIADLSIYIPQSPLDCRISINFEMKFEGDIDEVISSGFGGKIPDRQKDRLSYKQGPYQVDLTQVTHISSVNGVNRTEKEHELEVEISTAAIMEQGTRARNQEPHQYLPLVEGMLNNVFLLAGETPWPKPE